MIEVISAGSQTTIQDGGRPGHLAAGITVAGPQDFLSLRLANVLVGNAPTPPPFSLGPKGDAGLEWVLQGPKLRFANEAVIAVTGAEVELAVNGRSAPTFTSIYVEAGSEVSVTAARRGVRAHMAVAGGIDVPEVLGSRATHLLAGRGGVGGRALKRGDVLPVSPLPQGRLDRVGRAIRPEMRPTFPDLAEIRVVLGPQDELFLEESVAAFLAEEWTLSPVADRMGFRFNGPTLKFKERADHLVRDAGADPSNIVDDVIPVGGIQVPSGVEAIVMGVENPTVGGFAKIATVITTDLGRVGQLRPGQRARFVSVSPEEAVALSLRALESHSEFAVDGLGAAVRMATDKLGGLV